MRMFFRRDPDEFDELQVYVAGHLNPVGYITSWDDADGEVLCADMHVDPAYAGRCLSRALVRAQCRLADQRGVRLRLELGSTSRKTRRLRRLYERFGFRGDFGVDHEMVREPRRPPARPRRG